MANTRITQGVIKPNEDYDVRHINATGIITATNLNLTGVLTYEDVTNVDSIGVITARKGIVSSGVVTATAFHGDGSQLTGIDATALKDDGGNVKIQAQDSGAVHTGISTFDTIKVGSGVTIESNGQATFTGIVTATSFKLANGSDVGTGAGGTWSTYTAGIATSKSVGVNTSTLDDNDLVGVGNSFQGLYISNGMIIHDNTLSGNHYIGTAFNGLMAGPVNIEGTLSVDGSYVVV